MSLERRFLSPFSLFQWMLLVCLLPQQGCVVVTRHRSRSCRNIDAGIRLPNDGGTYFFSQRRYLEYDEDSTVEKATGPISRLGLSDLTRIDAAFTMPGIRNLVVIASGQNFYRYNTSRSNFRRRINEGSLQDDLGLPSDVDAAFGLRHQTTVIKGCHLWTLDAGTSGRFDRQNRTLEDWGVPCDLDAAVTWYDDSTVLLIKGHTMWKLHFRRDGTNEVEGPTHTDGLNICSWFLCGEANFIRPSDPMPGDSRACNGDARLCPLRLDQVTLAGLHNSGAGFSHGFGMFNCWVKNHGKSIYEQLELGIRHLDIDPCHDRCGYLGTCHSYFCGGSICAMIKQTRRFLLQHPDEVVTVNFNHEILEPRKVFRELTRQLKAQLRPLLSSAFRDSGQAQWPTLQESIRNNKRLFVIYAYIIQDEPHASYYRRNKWIHTEHWLGSTWREIELTPGCTGLVPTTRRMCYHRQYRELVEVSTVVTPAFTTCVTEMADTCRPRLMETLRTCEGYRYRHGKSPNVLLVDYPEVTPNEVTSVFHAVYLQNVRNILQHRFAQCHISIDAAVVLNNRGLIFSGTKGVVYDFDTEMQIDVKVLPDNLHHIDAAYHNHSQSGPGRITVIKDCFAWQVDPTNFSNLTQRHFLDFCQQHSITHDIDAAVSWNGAVYLFTGCSVIRLNSNDDHQMINLGNWGLPCDVDAVMTSQDGGSLYVFKDNFFWKYGGDGQATSEGHTKSWNMDAVRCDDDH